MIIIFSFFSSDRKNYTCRTQQPNGFEDNYTLCQKAWTESFLECDAYNNIIDSNFNRSITIIQNSLHYPGSLEKNKFHVPGRYIPSILSYKLYYDIRVVCAYFVFITHTKLCNRYLCLFSTLFMNIQCIILYTAPC